MAEERPPLRLARHLEAHFRGHGPHVAVAPAQVGVVPVGVAGVGVAGDPLPLFVEKLVDLHVLGEHRFAHPARRWAVEQHGHGRVHGLDDADVGVFEEEGEDGPRLGLGEGEIARPALGPAPPRQVLAGHGPPVLGVIAVKVQAADAVLIDPAVAVVVDPLRGNDVVALSVRRPLHEPTGGVVGIDDHGALAGRDLLPDLEDETVTVEILGRVFVEKAVPVVVVRPDRAPVRLGRVQIKFRAVRIVLDPDVDRLRIDELRQRRVFPVAAEDVPGEPERGLGRRHFSGMPVALDEHGRLVGVLARGLVVDRDLPDVPALEGLADGIEVDDIGIIAGPLAEEGVDFVVSVIMRKVQLSGGLGFREGRVNSREVADPMTDTADGVHLRRLRLKGRPISRPRLLGRRGHESETRD